MAAWGAKYGSAIGTASWSAVATISADGAAAGVFYVQALQKIQVVKV